VLSLAISASLNAPIRMRVRRVPDVMPRMTLTLMPLTERDLRELIAAPEAFAQRHALALETAPARRLHLRTRAAEHDARARLAALLSTRLYVLDGVRCGRSAV